MRSHSGTHQLVSTACPHDSAPVNRVDPREGSRRGGTPLTISAGSPRGVRREHSGELRTRADAEFREDLAHVVLDHAGGASLRLLNRVCVAIIRRLGA